MSRAGRQIGALQSSTAVTLLQSARADTYPVGWYGWLESLS